MCYSRSKFEIPDAQLIILDRKAVREAVGSVFHVRLPPLFDKERTLKFECMLIPRQPNHNEASDRS